MFAVIAYDVSTTSAEGRRRLRRVAQACEDYGVRVQKSVFECLLREADWVRLRHRLLREIDIEEDSLRVYFLDEDLKARIQHFGIKRPIDLEGPLIV